MYCIGLLASGCVQALNVRVQGTQVVLVVTWRPPSDIIIPATGYRLRYHKTSSSTWSSTRTIGSQQTQYTITGLEEVTTYEVEVWATFSIGEGSRRRATARTTSGITCSYHESFLFKVYCVLICCRPISNTNDICHYSLHYTGPKPSFWNCVL